MFFQNPFAKDFRANLVLGDRHYSQEYIVPGHKGRGDDVVVSQPGGPYKLTGNDTDGNASNILVIWFSYQRANPNYWSQMNVQIDTQATTKAAATYLDIVNALNADASFPGLFVASGASYGGAFSVSGTSNVGVGQITIRALTPSTDFRFFIQNGQAEEQLLFNAQAGIGELPTYFVRHQVTWQFTGAYQNPFNNRNFSYTNVSYATATTYNSLMSIVGIQDPGFASPYHSAAYSTVAPLGYPTVAYTTAVTIPTATQAATTTAFPDCMNALVSLNPYSIYNATANGGSNVDLGIIKRAVNVPTGAVLNATIPNPDWQLLRGKSGLFTFRKCQLDSNNNIVQMIEYPAGAKPGDLAKLTKYVRSGDTAAGNPNNCFYQMTEEPYVLTTADLVQPALTTPKAWGS